MLVYAQDRLGIFHYKGHSIYGIGWGRSPTDLPYDIYAEVRDSIKHGKYTSEWLSKKFNCTVSEIAFTLPELQSFPWAVLHKLASELRVLTKDTKKRLSIYRAILRKLRDGT
jgi:hypothetical protein